MVTNRKPRPSPKGTGKGTGCKHSSIIWPKDVWEALQKEVYILDGNGEIIGVRKGMSVNDVAVRSVRKELKVTIPKTIKVDPPTKRIIPRKALTKMAILEYYKTHSVVYPSDIATELSIDLRDVVTIVNELIASGEVVGEESKVISDTRIEPNPATEAFSKIIITPKSE